MRNYFLEKLFDINYRMAIHEGNANRRLASEALKIRLLPSNKIPDNFKKEFTTLRKIINETINNLPTSGLTPSKLGNIRNRTASKYIKLLIDIWEHVQHDNI